MPFAEIRGLQLYYEKQGSGPRLLVLLGSGSDLRNVPNIFSSPLSEHFELLAFDQRGQGQSDAPNEVYTMDDYADDAAALLEHVGWDSCHVMGISFGGMVAQEFALRHPERVKRLLLACTSSGGEGGASYPIHELDSSDPEAYVSALLSLFDVRFRDGYEELGPLPRGGKRRLTKQLTRLVTQAQEPERIVGTVRQLQARLGHDTYERLKQIEAPTLICGGRFDAIAPPLNLYRMFGQIPNAQLVMFRGGHLFFQDDPAAFVRFVDFFLEREDAERCLRERAMLAYLSDQFGEAREALTALSEVDDEELSAEGFFYLGENLRIERDDAKEAATYWQRVVDMCPDGRFGLLAKSQLQLYIDEDKSAAHGTLEQLCTAFPDFGLAYNYIADICLDWGQYEQVETHLEKAIQLDPGDVVSFQNRAFARLKQKQAEGALSDAKEALRQAPYYVEAFVTCGESYEALERFDDAFDAYERALALAPEDTCALVCRGALHARNQRWEEAMNDFDRAIKKDPNDGNAYAGRGRVYMTQGALEDAIKDFDLAISHGADEMWQCYLNRGYAYHQREMLDEAIRDYSETLYQRYETVDAVINRGFAYKQKGMMDAAFNDFCDAVGRNPEDPFALNNRGAMYLYRNNAEQALRDFDAAIERDDKEPDFFYNRACAREELGDNFGAATDLQQYLSLAIDGEHAHDRAELTERINELKAIHKQQAS